MAHLIHAGGEGGKGLTFTQSHSESLWCDEWTGFGDSPGNGFAECLLVAIGGPDLHPDLVDHRGGHGLCQAGGRL